MEGFLQSRSPTACCHRWAEEDCGSNLAVHLTYHSAQWPKSNFRFYCFSFHLQIHNALRTWSVRFPFVIDHVTNFHILPPPFRKVSEGHGIRVTTRFGSITAGSWRSRYSVRCRSFILSSSKLAFWCILLDHIIQLQVTQCFVSFFSPSRRRFIPECITAPICSLFFQESLLCLNYRKQGIRFSFVPCSYIFYKIMSVPFPFHALGSHILSTRDRCKNRYFLWMTL